MFFLLLKWCVIVVAFHYALSFVFSKTFNWKTELKLAGVSLFLGAIGAYFLTTMKAQGWMLEAVYATAMFLVQFALVKLSNIKPN